MEKKRSAWQFDLFGQKISFGRSSSTLRVETNIEATLADIDATEEVKPQLQQIIDFLKHPENFKGVGIPNGVLIVGLPSADKSLLAKAFAGEAHVPFFNISATDFVDDFPGVAASQIHELFKQARKRSPCVLFIEDIDEIFPVNSDTQADKETEKTQNQLLSEIDNEDGQKRIVVIASISGPEQLNPSLLSQGRFDRRFRVEHNQIGVLVSSWEAERAR